MPPEQTPEQPATAPRSKKDLISKIAEYVKMEKKYVIVIVEHDGQQPYCTAVEESIFTQ